MSTASGIARESQRDSVDFAIKDTINATINDLIESLPDPTQLNSDERRGIIARYSSVLEGNFIYWMTATLISVKSEEARPIIMENLHEEVRDSHPAMLRRFAKAAHAVPTEADSCAVDENLEKVRLFLGRLSGVQSLATMAFFEGFIQKFMGYLMDLAVAQGSADTEYTDVHGVCDIEHTEGLFRALSAEMAAKPLDPDKGLFEGVNLLRTLIENIVFNRVGIVSA